MLRLLLATAILPCSLLAADPPKISAKSEPLAPPRELTPALVELLARQATSVSDADGLTGVFWLRKDIPLTASKDPASYHSIKSGTVIGALKLHRAWSDFRTQEAPAGVYTLRYFLQPESKDHEGTAPQRDFVILVPASEDTKPEVLPLKTLVQKSGKATGGTHPVVMLLYPYPKPSAEPIVLKKGKRIAIGVRCSEEFGFAFTVVGSSTD